MSESKLTVRVPRETIDRAKVYARQHGTTLTRLVTAYLEQLEASEDWLANAPIVRSLWGSLSPEVGVEDYHAYLEAKFGYAQENSD